MLEPLYDQVERLLAPIEDTIDNVRSICGAVGVSV